MQAWLQRQQQRLTWSSSTRRTGCRRSCFHWSPRCRMPSCRRAPFLQTPLATPLPDAGLQARPFPKILSQRKRSQCCDHMTAFSWESRRHVGGVAERLTSPRHKLTSEGSFPGVGQAHAAGDLDRAEALCVTFAAFCSTNAWVLASRLPEARLFPGSVAQSLGWLCQSRCTAEA